MIYRFDLMPFMGVVTVTNHGTALRAGSKHDGSGALDVLIGPNVDTRIAPRYLFSDGPFIVVGATYDGFEWEAEEMG